MTLMNKIQKNLDLYFNNDTFRQKQTMFNDFMTFWSWLYMHLKKKTNLVYKFLDCINIKLLKKIKVLASIWQHMHSTSKELLIFRSQKQIKS